VTEPAETTSSAEPIERFVKRMVAHPYPVQDGSVSLTPEQVKARGRRNLALAVSIAGFVILVFVITLAKLQAGILDRPL
jgi:hypothetical protein